MRAGTHILAGVLSGLLVAQSVSTPTPPESLLIALCAAGGALLPDLDHPKAALRQKFGIVGHGLFFWLKHRGPTHSALVAIAVILLGLRLHPIYGLAAGAGYASHILGDLMTHSGTLLFFPIWNGSVHILPPVLRFTTGGVMEKLIAAALLTACLFILFQPYL